MSSSSATMRRDVRIHLTNPMVSIEDSNHGSPQRLVHRKILSEIQTLQAGDSFTDVEFVTRDVGGRDLGCGRSAVRGHSMILAAVSTFLKGWMADTFVPNLQVSFPTEHFSVLDSQKAFVDVSELNKNSRSTVFVTQIMKYSTGEFSRWEVCI